MTRRKRTKTRARSGKEAVNEEEIIKKINKKKTKIINN